MVVQALDLAGGHVAPVEGPRIAVAVDSLCVHGDTPGAVAAARAIRDALEQANWHVVAPDGNVAAPRVEGRVGTAASGADEATVLAFGDRALLVEPADRRAPDTSWVLRIAGRAHRRWPQATVVPGLASVLVVFERPSLRPEPRGREVLDPLSQGCADPAVAAPGGSSAGAGGSGADGSSGPDGPRLHSIATRYDGPDLAQVAAMVHLPAAEVVRRHGAAPWTVAAIGFSPGFGYLTSGDPLFAGVARRGDPRARVPRGSVALAAGMCAVYPSATPGGWQLIGSTSGVLFDVDAEHPALLSVGDRVEFVEVP
jgi:allophanate hydrolase subunit 1